MSMPPDLRDRTILIVDDTPANLTLAVAHSGDEALRRVAFAPPDLILLDVMLPGIDGFEVCRALKAGPAAGAARPGRLWPDCCVHSGSPVSALLGAKAAACPQGRAFAIGRS